LKVHRRRIYPDAVPAASGASGGTGYLLLESGSHILEENGSSKLLLEGGLSSSVALPYWEVIEPANRTAVIRTRCAGRVWLPARHAGTAGGGGTGYLLLESGSHILEENGSSKLLLEGGLSAGAFVVPTRPARDPQPRRRRIPGLAWIAPFAPPGTSTAPAVWYHVYANTGAGDPINYTTTVATVDGLTWTSSPLSYAGDWKFGVRAFYYPSGLEEQNLDCAVEITLDSGGTDITNRPAPPTGLRAIAVKGGNIKVEWSYPNPASTAKTPTGFHVYIGAGSLSYTSPAAAVSYGSSIANVWTATLTGLTSGTTYTIGVRAYNATAEEPNTASVTCTSDASGPTAVQSLMAVAV